MRSHGGGRSPSSTTPWINALRELISSLASVWRKCVLRLELDRRPLEALLDLGAQVALPVTALPMGVQREDDLVGVEEPKRVLDRCDGIP